MTSEEVFHDPAGTGQELAIRGLNVTKPFGQVGAFAAQPLGVEGTRGDDPDQRTEPPGR